MQDNKECYSSFQKISFEVGSLDDIWKIFNEIIEFVNYKSFYNDFFEPLVNHIQAIVIHPHFYYSLKMFMSNRLSYFSPDTFFNHDSFQYMNITVMVGDIDDLYVIVFKDAGIILEFAQNKDKFNLPPYYKTKFKDIIKMNAGESHD